MDQFYNKKIADAIRRLKLLQDCHGRYTDVPQGLDRDEGEEVMAALLELRGQLRKLQWYGEVNRRGFIKITKKWDKKVGHTLTQQRYLESKVEPKQFATNIELLGTMKAVNGWMSKLGEVKYEDDASSTHSSHSLQQVTSKAMPKLPAELLDSMEQAIRADRAPTLVGLISRAETHDPDARADQISSLSLSLLQRAILYQGRRCIDELLARITNLEEEDDINKRNCLHRIVIKAGRSRPSSDDEPGAAAKEIVTIDDSNYIKPAAHPVLNGQQAPTKRPDRTVELHGYDKSVALLNYILDKLRPQQRGALQARDTYGRMPLHYAAQYGSVVICEVIIARMKAWSQYEVSQGIDAPFWQDMEGLSPLHLSVMGGHPLTAKTILNSENENNGSAVHMSRSGEILALAVKANFVLIARLLVDAGADVDFQDGQGETALHIAAHFGHTESARILLAGNQGHRASTEISESTFGWAPLHIACVDGWLAMVKLLVAAGANVSRNDTSGWTAKEHATLRGHLDISRALIEGSPPSIQPATDATRNSDANASQPGQAFSGNRTQTTTNGNTKENSRTRTTEPVKTFGHRYLRKESMILVSLGTMDPRKAVEAVNLDRIPLTDAHFTQLDTALSVVVSASGANGEPSIIDLPVQDNISTEPIVFTAIDAAKVKLLFDIVPTYSGSSDRVVGRGVALLSSIKPSIGSKRITLQGDVAVPIISANTLDVIGSVNFNFLIITPFTHPNMTISEDLTYWKRMSSTMVIGHRGLGKNSVGRDSLQLGENTLQSFIAAANLGASYVEFDVQLTKDLVPVIYHDFLVSETGIDAPVHTLTLEQFLHINDGRTPRASRPASPTQASNTPPNGATQKQRAMSVGSLSKDDPTSSMSERMKHTRDFKAKGFKSNTRGNFIQAPFTTLEEMFKTLPVHIGFNIEMKYPMLDECEAEEMDTYAVELNSFVDTVLTEVYDLGKGRNIIFSSFNPDVCLLLSFKQPSIPVLFLTGAGSWPVGDIRASSLQEAIRFASRWNLLGIVSAAEPLVMSPRLVRVVKESGLVCVSYGTLNNDPGNVNVRITSLHIRSRGFGKC